MQRITPWRFVESVERPGPAIDDSMDDDFALYLFSEDEIDAVGRKLLNGDRDVAHIRRGAPGGAPASDPDEDGSPCTEILCLRFIHSLYIL